MMTSLPTMMSDEFYLNSLLQYSQQVVELDHCCPLLWDVRRPPQSARRVFYPDEYITPFYLSQPVTYLPKRFLRIVSGMLPEEWVIEIRITIGDVLKGVYTTLMHPIRHHEWERLWKAAASDQHCFQRALRTCRRSRTMSRGWGAAGRFSSPAHFVCGLIVIVGRGFILRFNVA